MDDLESTLRDAFETENFEVNEVGVNRGHVRVGFLSENADADELKSIVYDVLDEDTVFGMSVSTESTDNNDGVSTVLSFRYRE